MRTPYWIGVIYYFIVGVYSYRISTRGSNQLQTIGDRGRFDVEDLDAYPSDRRDIPYAGFDESSGIFKLAGDASKDPQPAKGFRQKKAFCNGFIGCRGWGRRWKRPLRIRNMDKNKQTKKALCNPFLGHGCVSKRTEETERSLQLPSDNGITSLKRLFCNAYGGCPGRG